MFRRTQNIFFQISTLQNPLKSPPHMDPKALWNAQAQTYKDTVETTTFTPALTLANMLEIGKAQDIIEVACATGILSIHFLRNLTNAKTLVSTDISESMIELANARKAATEGINKDIKHEFVVADAQDMSFMKDESVDTYISNLCIHLVPDENKFLQEAKRILKKGGKIGLTVPNRDTGLPRLVFSHLEKYGWKQNFPKDVYALGERDVMIKLLQDNGFEVRFCWDDHVKQPYYEDSDVEKFFSSGHMSKVMAGFDEETQKKIKDGIMKDFHELRKQFIPFQLKMVSIVAHKPSL